MAGAVNGIVFWCEHAGAAQHAESHPAFFEREQAMMVSAYCHGVEEEVADATCDAPGPGK